jgi:hypothetical protein
VNLFNEPSRCRPNDIPVLCGAGLRGDPPQDAALTVVYVPTRSEDQADLRYSITGTKRLQNLDLASSASQDSDGVDARKLITRCCNENQSREQQPDFAAEQGSQSHLKLSVVTATETIAHSGLLGKPRHRPDGARARLRRVRSS